MQSDCNQSKLEYLSNCQCNKNYSLLLSSPSTVIHRPKLTLGTTVAHELVRLLCKWNVMASSWRRGWWRRKKKKRVKITRGENFFSICCVDSRNAQIVNLHFLLTPPHHLSLKALFLGTCLSTRSQKQTPEAQSHQLVIYQHLLPIIFLYPLAHEWR